MGRLDNFLRVGFFAFAVGTAGAAVWLGSSGHDVAAGIIATLTVILCVYVFLSRFKRFKGLGFEGELWEQEMERAAELRNALKDLSERVGESVYWNAGEGARVQEPDKILGIIERTDRNLRAAEIDPKKIEELKRPWHKCVMRDLAAPIPRCVDAKLQEIMDNFHTEIRAEKQRRMAERPGTTDPTPREAELLERHHAMSQQVGQSTNLIWRDDFENVPRLLREFIDQNPWLQPEHREAIYQDCREEFLDIDQYERQRTIRRPKILNPM